jgi:hypothetical protein
MTELSKRQQKINRAAASRDNYLMGQSAYQGIKILVALQRGYEDGLHIYEQTKHKMTPEEIESIEAMKVEQEAQLAMLKENLGLPSDWTYKMLDGYDESTDTTPSA